MPRNYGSIHLIPKWERAREDKAAIERDKKYFAKIRATRKRLEKEREATNPLLMARVKNQRILKRDNPETWAPAKERDRLRDRERYQKKKDIMQAKFKAQDIVNPPPPPGKLVCPFGTAIAVWIKMTDEEKLAHLKTVKAPFTPVRAYRPRHPRKDNLTAS